MKIVDIFAEDLAGHLYAIHYPGEEQNEFDRLLDLWTDVEYLRNFAKENNLAKVNQFINDISENAEDIQDLIEELLEEGNRLEQYFQALHNSEIGAKILSLQKGKTNKLRLYAIKIDEDCFLITGGAIKMSQNMEDHYDTRKELPKLNNARDYLMDEGIVDRDSFYELKNDTE